MAVVRAGGHLLNLVRESVSVLLERSKHLLKLSQCILDCGRRSAAFVLKVKLNEREGSGGLLFVRKTARQRWFTSLVRFFAGCGVHLRGERTAMAVVEKAHAV